MLCWYCVRRVSVIVVSPDRQCSRLWGQSLDESFILDQFDQFCTSRLTVTFGSSSLWWLLPLSLSNLYILVTNVCYLSPIDQLLAYKHCLSTTIYTWCFTHAPRMGIRLTLGSGVSHKSKCDSASHNMLEAWKWGYVQPSLSYGVFVCEHVVNYSLASSPWRVVDNYRWLL